MTSAEKSLSIRIANSVYTYFENMPGYDETCMPTYGVIYALVVQGIEDDRAADSALDAAEKNRDGNSSNILSWGQMDW